MLEVVINILQETWWLTAEMAPYLLLGFVIAGLLRIFFTENWVKRHLGGKGFSQIFKAVIIGIPLPLCSCGVIPVAAGIRRQGGQRGAVAAFTAATPQTGVDAIAATAGMLGWVFALVRIGIAFINGIVAGLVVEKWGEQDEDSPPPSDQPEPSSCCCETEEPTNCCEEKEIESCCESEEPASCCSSENTATSNKLWSGLRFGLVTLPKELFTALVIGLFLAGTLSALAPEDLFTNFPGGTFGVYLGMTLLSLPLYICSTGSIPMAFTFLMAGMSPGAVLIFLIAGPASNAATITTLWSIIGPKSTLAYILSIIGTAWAVAMFIDFSGISLLVAKAVHHHDMGISAFQHGMAGVLVAVLVFSQLNRLKLG